MKRAVVILVLMGILVGCNTGNTGTDPGAAKPQIIISSPGISSPFYQFPENSILWTSNEIESTATLILNIYDEGGVSVFEDSSIENTGSYTFSDYEQLDLDKKYYVELSYNGTSGESGEFDFLSAESQILEYGFINIGTITEGIDYLEVSLENTSSWTISFANWHIEWDYYGTAMTGNFVTPTEIDDIIAGYGISATPGQTVKCKIECRDAMAIDSCEIVSKRGFDVYPISF